MPKEMGVWLMIVGLSLLLMGLLIYSGWFRWLGKLPGDFHFQTEHAHIYFPLTTMILLSLFISFLLYFIRKIF